MPPAMDAAKYLFSWRRFLSVEYETGRVGCVCDAVAPDSILVRNH